MGLWLPSHSDGYTPFAARLTDHIVDGTNLVTVKVNGEEDPDIPPFGGQIDYLTYAGIYREVWLQTTGPTWIDSVKIETPDPLSASKCVRARYELAGRLPDGGEITLHIFDRNGRHVATASKQIDGRTGEFELCGLNDLELWDIDSPVLYEAEFTLNPHFAVADSVSVKFGFRSAEFLPDGFQLNGRPLKIVGLNRHQSYPYVGYAMSRRAQERDAEILKINLNCNLVRTSHYPQSPWFLDHCDRIGLLVFEEIPGWQHIGGELWKQRALANVGGMIRRDWNRPSIVLWGVRINESPDDSELYSQTTELARKLDSTRQIAGVRNFTGSEFLEDVYTMNDFAIGSEEMPGVNRGRIALRTRSEVTCIDRPVPYMVTEFNGHMYPTKIWDNEQRQMEHVTRFLQVLDAAFGDPEIAGCIGWCMADYNTHKDFGSGDRICHHGVLDMFRVPKFAASVYASQSDPGKQVVLQPVTWWARGERSIGGVLPLIILTNAEEVELRSGSEFAMRFRPDRAAYPNLPHPPVIIDQQQIPPGCLGAWGQLWEDATFTAFVEGHAVATRLLVSDPVAHEMEIAADSDWLLSTEKDQVRIVVKALDQAGNLLPFLTDPVSITVDGPATLLGPSLLSFRGGVAAFWVESTELEGKVRVHVTSPRFDQVSTSLNAVSTPPDNSW